MALVCVSLCGCEKSVQARRADSEILRALEPSKYDGKDIYTCNCPNCGFEFETETKLARHKCENCGTTYSIKY